MKRKTPQTREYKRAYYEAHKENYLEYSRRWYEKHKEQHRRTMKRTRCRRYGLSVEQYRQLRQKQMGKCAICQKKTKLQIDHNHTSGRVRGLLCQHCNQLLSRAFDSIPTLRSAIKYLKRSGG